MEERDLATQAKEIAPHLVALIFAADGPLDAREAARVLEVRQAVVEEAVNLLLSSPPLGLIVQKDGTFLQLATSPESADVVRRLRGLDAQARLSGPALEVLAVIAYRQPVTRADIESIRGVNSDSALATLLGRGLIEEVGRKDAVGRPVLFGTTMAFLEHLGMTSLDELPPLPPTSEN